MGKYVGLSPEAKEASCQTDQFLLYLTLEDRLSHIYLQYRRLQAQLTEAHAQLAAEQATTHFLAASLRETTAIFLAHSRSQTPAHIHSLGQLDRRIHQEQLELDLINAPLHAQPDRKQPIQKGKALPSQRAAVDREDSSLLIRQGQDRQVLAEVSVNRQPEIVGYAKQKEKEREKQQRKETRLTSATNRYSKHHRSMRQDENNAYSTRQMEPKTARERPQQKEVDCQEMLERMEAELKYKQFMSQFCSPQGNWRQN